MALPRPAQAQGTCQGSLAASASAAPALAKFVPAAERSGVVFHYWLDPNRPAAHLILENTNPYPVAVRFQAELRGASGPATTGTRCVWIRAGEFVLDRPGVTVFEYPATLTAVRIASAQIARLDPSRPDPPSAAAPAARDTARPRAASPEPARPRPAPARPAQRPAAASPNSLRASRRALAIRDSVRASRRAAATRDSVLASRHAAARRDSAAGARRATALRTDSAPARRRTAVVRPDSAPRRVASDTARVIATQPRPVPPDTSLAVAVFPDSALPLDTAAARAADVASTVERAGDPAIRASLQRVPAARQAVRSTRREGPPPSATHATTLFSVAAGALLVPAGAVLGLAVAGAAFLLGGLVPLGALRRAAARLRRRG